MLLYTYLWCDVLCLLIPIPYISTSGIWLNFRCWQFFIDGKWTNSSKYLVFSVSCLPFLPSAVLLTRCCPINSAWHQYQTGLTAKDYVFYLGINSTVYADQNCHLPWRIFDKYLYHGVPRKWMSVQWKGNNFICVEKYYLMVLLVFKLNTRIQNKT